MKEYLKSGSFIGILMLLLIGCGQPVVPSSQLTYTEIIEHKELASNSSTYIKLNLIKNPNIPSSILQKFYEDENEDEEVRFQAYIHDNFKKY